MDFDSIRPLISGTIGAILALWLTCSWARWIPTSRGRKSISDLKREYGTRVTIANWLAALGMFSAVGFYLFHIFPSNDWRGFGLGMGLMAGLPLAFIFGSTIYRGIEQTKECLVYFSISQRTPPLVLCTILFLCILGGCIALAFTIH